MGKKKGRKNKKFEYAIVQRNKYLDDLGIPAHSYGLNFSDKNDKHWDKWKKEKELYGFDSRETWCMDGIFMEWLYCHMLMYKKEAGRIIDLKYHKFRYKNKEYTQKQLINKIIKLSRYYLLHYDDEDAETAVAAIKKGQKAARLWAVVLPVMNW